MNCMEARRMVTPFVKKELSEKDTEAFLDHVETCKDCMDELDLCYIAFHASNLLDSGDIHEYNFEKMLREEIRQDRRRFSRRKFGSLLRMILVSLAEVLLLISTIFGVNFRNGGSDPGIFQRIFVGMQTEISSDAEEGLRSDTELTQKEENKHETENRTD